MLIGFNDNVGVVIYGICDIISGNFWPNVPTGHEMPVLVTEMAGSGVTGRERGGDSCIWISSLSKKLSGLATKKAVLGRL